MGSKQAQIWHAFRPLILGVALGYLIGRLKSVEKPQASSPYQPELDAIRRTAEGLHFEQDQRNHVGRS